MFGAMILHDLGMVVLSWVHPAPINNSQYQVVNGLGGIPA